MLTVAALLFAAAVGSDDFRHGLRQWTVELEKGGDVYAASGTLTVDVPGGATVWFNRELSGPVRIEYEATAVKAGGANDRVSDLNCFWMAAGADVRRSGKFEDYDLLRTYYVGLGGNSNTTTRFRRYQGAAGVRPLLGENNSILLEANVPRRIRLEANGQRIRYYVDEKLLFDFDDPEPYTRGRFGFRTTQSHLEIRNFKIHKPIEKHAQ